MGATFRDKKFILEGFEKLLSPAGKAALAKVSADTRKEVRLKPDTKSSSRVGF